MNDLIKRFENGEWLTQSELQALAAELGNWVIEVYEQDQADEAEHLALVVA